jgi:hypothetical protein
MKSSFPPLYLGNGNPTISQSKLDNPLAAFLSCLILIAVVTVHFYALGAKSDPALLAYDESASWRFVESSSAPILASASGVLFDSRAVSPLKSDIGTGTIRDANAMVPSMTSRGFGMATSPSNSFGLEASLLVLNFGQ